MKLRERLKKFAERELKMEFTKKTLNNKSGSALMIAIFTFTFLMVVATEISYETTVEYLVSAQSVDQIKAYYAAKAATELSLLRVLLFRKAVATFGDALPDKSILDPIWNLPFSWPPVVPDGVGSVDKSQLQASVKKSMMKSQYLATIESEGSKIDLNDLGSTSKVVQKITHEQILQMFKSRLQGEDEFAEKYRTYDFDKLINYIADWVSDGDTSLNGGDKKSAYKYVTSDFIPPKQPFKTIQELHMVATMEDDLFEVLSPRVTIYGSKGINVNQASKDILMSLSSQITEARANQIMQGRSDPKRGPFKDEQDFVSFLNSIGVVGNPFNDGKNNVVPLMFDAEYNFRIKTTGISGKVRKNITAIVYDYDEVKQRLADQLSKDGTLTKPSPSPTPPPTNNGLNPAPTATPSPTPDAKKSKIKVPNDRPNVIYWDEN